MVLSRIPATAQKAQARKSYQDYLQSERWQTLREVMLTQAERRCQLCNADNVELNVHHRSYERIRTAEEAKDLVVLCKACHEKFHGLDNKKSKKAKKAKVNVVPTPNWRRVIAAPSVEQSAPNYEDVAFLKALILDQRECEQFIDVLNRRFPDWADCTTEMFHNLFCALAQGPPYHNRYVKSDKAAMALLDAVCVKLPENMQREPFHDELITKKIIRIRREYYRAKFDDIREQIRAAEAARDKELVLSLFRENIETLQMMEKAGAA
jgi:hypothetical protein